MRIIEILWRFLSPSEPIIPTLSAPSLRESLGYGVPAEGTVNSRTVHYLD